VKREAAPVGAPCWIDLFSSDTDKVRAFYGELFGWTSEAAGAEYGGYINFAKDGVPVAGCMANDGTAGTPDAWSVYLATEDAKATDEAVVANGGQVLLPAMDVMGLGAMTVCSDVGGASIAAWQPGSHQGFGVLNEPGAPAWFELVTRDHAAARAFYAAVFGWDLHLVGDTDEFRYATLGEGDDAKAGIMDASAFLPEGTPDHWSVYVNVADVDDTLAQLVELGGTIVVPAEDTPFGRLAAVTDPMGATFKLIG
jgi:predicted enzyme related to lactoylglutathione lyase